MRVKLLVLISFVLFFSFFPIKIFAQSPLIPSPTLPLPTQTMTNTTAIPQDLHVRSQSVIIELLAAISCQLSGVDPINPEGKCLGIDMQNKKIGYVESNGGAIGMMDHMIASSFQVPISSSQYVADLSSHFGITKTTYAQTSSQKEGSTGWVGLRMVLEIWKVFSNIVYFFFVLLFLFIGLGIMLRIKVDPRTVMTFQNQIPKIIITMILVFFSYAIAGVLVDIMWVSIYFIYGVVSRIQNVNLDNLHPSNIQATSVFGAMGGIFNINSIASPAAFSVKNAIQNLMGITGAWSTWWNPLNLFGIPLPKGIGANFNAMTFIIDAISGIAGIFAAKNASILAPPVGSAVKWVPFVGTGIADTINDTSRFAVQLGWGAAGYASSQTLLRTFLPFLLPYIIIFIGVFIALFRLWFELIRAYIYILIGVILAPFWIAFGLVPGSTLGFGPWLKNVFAYLAVYPTTYFMITLAMLILNAYNKIPDKNTVFVPPFIGNQNDAANMGAIISMMIILITPNVVNIVKDAIKAPNFKYTSTIGQSLNVGPGVVRGAGSTAMAYHSPRITKGGQWVTGGIPGILGKLFH